MSISSITTRTDASPYAYGLTSTSSVSGSTAGQSNASVSSTTAGADSFRGDFASLLAAVRAGDIGSAQTALTSLQSDLSANSASYSPGSTSSSSSASPAQTDLDALFQAVKTGNLSGAQTALTSLQSDLQSSAAPTDANAQNTQQPAPTGHHHHHHHGGGMASALSQALASTSMQSTSAGSTSASDVS